MRFNSVRRSFIGALAALFTLLVVASLAAAEGIIAMERHFEAADRSWLPAYAPVAGHALATAAGQPLDRAAVHAEAVAGRQAEQLTLAALAAFIVVATLIALGLAALVDRRVLRPLQAVTRGMTGLAERHLGTPLPMREGRGDVGVMAEALTVFEAKAAALTDAERCLDALGTHDALTGLPNRRRLTAHLDAALRIREAGTQTCAVMLIDLDHFRPINELHGHAAGDVVLQVTAARLRALVGPDDIVARCDGDSFAIGMAARDSQRGAVRDAVALATHALAAMEEAVEIEGARLTVGASIGVALGPLDGGGAEEILRAADLAMQRAKQDGRGTLRFFKSSMDQDLRSRTALEADVRTALRDDAIEPYYQPLVALASDRIAGFEVLARWRHPDRGSVSPGCFIPVVERLGLLDQMTAALLHRACRDARAWGPDVTLAVNVSPAQFQNIGFAAQLALILRAERFDPRRLEVEVTETALVTDLQAARHTLEALQRLGVALVLDDFGTGYSNLSHLCEFRFDKIKIDSSFIRAMPHSQECHKIVDAILELAHGLDLPVVAEGVETVENRHLLASRGCAFGQGYWFSQAVPADLATAMLKRHNHGPLRAAG